MILLDACTDTAILGNATIERPQRMKEFEEKPWDPVGEALLDLEAGPVKHTPYMTVVFIIACLWALVSLAVLVAAFIFPVSISFAYIATVTMTLSPFVGIFVFVTGYLRRSRFAFGKSVERIGLAILVISLVNIFGAMTMASKL